MTALRLGALEFEAEGDRVAIRAPGGEGHTPRYWFLRAIHRLILFDLRLNDVRLYGGLQFKEEPGDRVRVGLRAPVNYSEAFPRAEAIAFLKKAHAEFAPPGWTEDI